jgi:hypothetical protein
VVPDWSAATPLDLLRDPAHRQAASWPLAFGLTCLARRMRDDSWQLGKMIRQRLDGG